MINLISLLEKIIQKLNTKANITDSFGYGYGTLIQNNTDLNTITTVGNYRVKNSTAAATLFHSPVTNKGFILKVFHGGIGAVEDNTSDTLVQLVITNGTQADPYPDSYIRFYNDSWGSQLAPQLKWSAWAKYVTTSSSKPASIIKEYITSSPYSIEAGSNLYLKASDFIATSDSADLETPSGYTPAAVLSFSSGTQNVSVIATLGAATGSATMMTLHNHSSATRSYNAKITILYINTDLITSQ